MINYVWTFMIVTGIVTSFFTGKIEAVSSVIMTSCTSAVELCIGMVGVYALWMGLMNIAKDSGLVESISKKMQPVLSRLFPSTPKNSPAIGFISLNIIANMLGMGNAATPFGLKAMEELQKHNKMSPTASDDMCMFLIINSSSVQLIPATVIALRQAAGSLAPTDITLTALFATFCSTAVGIVAAKAMQSKRGG